MATIKIVLGQAICFIQQKSFTIACECVCDTYSFDKIADNTQKIYETFDLSPRRVKGTVADNAINFTKVFKEFGAVAHLEEASKEHGNKDEREDATTDQFILPKP